MLASILFFFAFRRLLGAVKASASGEPQRDLRYIVDPPLPRDASIYVIENRGGRERVQLTKFRESGCVGVDTERYVHTIAYHSIA